MTHKDYLAIAEAIRYTRSTDTIVCEYTANKIAHALADSFENTNDRFDRTEFLRACQAHLTESI